MGNIQKIAFHFSPSLENVAIRLLQICIYTMVFTKVSTVKSAKASRYTGEKQAIRGQIS